MKPAQLRALRPSTLARLQELPPAEQRLWLLCCPLRDHEGRVESTAVAALYERFEAPEEPAAGLGALLGELVDLGLVEALQRDGDGYLVRLSNGWRD